MAKRFVACDQLLEFPGAALARADRTARRNRLSPFRLDKDRCWDPRLVGPTVAQPSEQTVPPAVQRGLLKPTGMVLARTHPGPARADQGGRRPIARVTPHPELAAEMVAPAVECGSAQGTRMPRSTAEDWICINYLRSCKVVGLRQISNPLCPLHRPNSWAGVLPKERTNKR